VLRERLSPLRRVEPTLLAGWQVFLSGFVLGISIAAPPGPVAAAATVQAARSWLRSWMVLLGATAADGIFFLLTYLGLISLIASEEARDILFLVGAAFMFYLALSTLRGARRGPAPAEPAGGRYPFLLGLTIGVSNPFQLAWWITVGIGMISTFGPGIVAGFFAGIVAWTVIFSTLVHEGLSRYRRAYPFIVYASAAILAAFGAWFLYAAISSLA
jgi:threonine/homoserine/homoserine lactone efflux protein